MKNNKYLVALCTGGLMECPTMYYEDFQIIEATNEEEARKIYNEKNKCFYFYGSTICKYKPELDFLLKKKKEVPVDVVNAIIKSSGDINAR